MPHYNQPEKVLCAATHYLDFPKPAQGCSNIEKGIVLCGKSHSDIIQQHVVLCNKTQHEMGLFEQGFVTTENRFIGRKEAFIMAAFNSQITEEGLRRGGDNLYSEFLY